MSLQFLVEFYEQVVKPYNPTMTVKQVQEEIIIPATNDLKCSFIDKLLPNMYVTPHAFISHAFNNQLIIMVESLKAYFKGAVFAEIYVWIDIFIINQHRPGDDLLDGRTLKATIEASESVVVCLDKNTLPLSRLWCLYEIGSTPIEKLVLLTHGFDASELGRAYAKIDANNAGCFLQSDMDMIKNDIRKTMIQRNFVSSAATVEEALTAFTRVLKLLLILKPTSYSTDMAALLDRAADYQRYPLPVTVGRACTGGKLICIVGGSGEGKSTLAAALVTMAIRIDAYHFCKQSDVRRQDRGLVIRSLSYQLATRHEAFAQTILDMTPSQVESISDDTTAWKLLIEDPLRAAGGHQFTILVDALDEGGLNGQMISFLVELDNVMIGTINIIVTTRPEPALLSPLRSHWKGNCYIEFTPLELRGEVQSGGGVAVSPLLRTLRDIIQRRNSTIAVPDEINTAYDMIFGAMKQHRAVLEVVLASYEPQSLSDLKDMDLLESARKLPGYGELFLERENKLHLLHRSIAEWLREPAHGGVDIKSGHSQLAAHIWDTTLSHWLPPITAFSPPSTVSVDISREPSTGSYSLKYALHHLREVDRFDDIKVVLFRLPLLQTLLKEKGVGALIKDILSLIVPSTFDHPILLASMKKLIAVLSLSSPALLGSDASKCLPTQLLGRLRETETDRQLISLRRESAASFTTGKWLKPLKSTLQTPGSLEMTMWHEDDVLDVITLSDGRLVSCSSDKTLRIWNIATGDCEKVLTGHEDFVSGVISLPDGRLVSWSNDKTLRIWNVTTGDCEMVLSGHQDAVHEVIALPSGRRLVSWSNDKSLRIWNVTTGDCENILTGHEKYVCEVLAIPAGRIVSRSQIENTLRIWNVVTGVCVKVLTGHELKINSVILLPSDGCRLLVSCSDDQTLRIWNTISGNCERVLSGHEADVCSVIALPDGGHIASCSRDTKVRIWNVMTGSCERVLSGHENAVHKLISLPGGRLVSHSRDDSTVRVWNTTTGDCEIVLSGNLGGGASLVVLPDGHRLVSCSMDRTVRVWNTTTGTCERFLSGHEDLVHSVIVLPDDRIVSYSKDKTVRVWNPSIDDDCTKEVGTGHRDGGGNIFAIVLPDCRIVSCSSSHALHMWNANTCECEGVIATFQDESFKFMSLSDGRLLSQKTSVSDHSRNWKWGSEVFIQPLTRKYWLWSSERGGGGFCRHSLDQSEFDRLSQTDAFTAVDEFDRYNLAPGYSVSGNWMDSESFGRVYVDGSLRFVVKVGDVIAAFQENGIVHWFKEVST